MTSQPILIMAGGTGGHVFPALAVADALRAMDRSVIWLGSPRGIENRVVPEAGIPLEHVRVAGLRGKGALTWFLAPFKLAVAIWDAIKVVQRVRPSVVLGMGGFASGPGGFAAWLLRKPLVIHEQNAAPGLTNRLLAGLAREVLEAFPGSFSASVKAKCIGNPVRADILAIAAPNERLANRTGPMRLLVVGGSLGAQALNEVVPAAVAVLKTQRPDIAVEIWHQSGEATFDTAQAAYAQHDVDARLVKFIDDMAEAYTWADMVVCRAGALTVSELAAAGLPSVLVPYPSAVDDHQTRNAGYLVSADAAVLLPQSSLSAETLAAELALCGSDRELLKRRALNAHSLARPAATNDLLNACLAQERAA